MQGILDRLGIITDEVSKDLARSARLDRRARIEACGNPDVRREERGDAERRRSARRAASGRGAGCLFPRSRRRYSNARSIHREPSHPAIDSASRRKGSKAHFAKLDRVIAIAKILGTRRIRIFSFWREQEPVKYRPEIVAHLKRAGDIARRQDTLLLVENEPSCNGGFAEEVGQIVRSIDNATVRALWDPGNEAYAGREAFPAGYAHMKDVLAHVHLKDAYIRQDGTPRCVPLGSGTVAVVPQFRALAADGYDGLFTIETHYKPEGGSSMAGCRMTLDAIRTLSREV